MTQLLKRLVLVLSLLVIGGTASAQDTVFEIEELNPGLAGVRSSMDLSTPQSTLEAFLQAAANEEWQRAAETLDMSSIDPMEQASLGPVLAQQLDAILDRKVVISWQSLPERPDALDANAAAENPMAGQVRRSILLGLLELNGRSVSVRLNRVKPENEAALWMFSQQTVDNIPALFEQHGPTAFERSLPDWMRAKTSFNLRVWEVFALPLMAVLVALATYSTWHFSGWITSKTPRNLGAAVLRSLRAPATLFVLALSVQVLTQRMFVVSGIVSNILEPAIVLAYVAAFMVLMVNAIDAILDWLTPSDVTDLSEPGNEDARSLVTTLSAARRIALVIAVLLGVGLVLASANVFRLLGFSLLASAGALTLILGFAAREVLGNIMASLQIALNRSARVGDQLVYDGHLCTVERIHFTFVQLHVWDDTRLIVPVLKFVSDEFTNRNLVYPGMTRRVVLKLSNRIDIDKMRDRFEAYCEDRKEIEEDDAECLVIDQDAHGIDLRFTIPVPNPVKGWDEEVALREAMIKASQQLEVEQQDDLIPHMGLSPNPKVPQAARDQTPDLDDDAA